MKALAVKVMVLLAMTAVFAAPVAAAPLATAPLATAPIPSLPHYFYGTVIIDGAAAPIGTTVEARAPGATTGSFNPIVTTQAGKYGDANPAIAVPRLLVQGEITEGATIEFYVNGVKASQTAAWHSGQITMLDLTVNVNLPPLAVSTGTAFGITTSTAILTGSLMQLGGSASAGVSFQWGPTQAYGYETPEQTVSAPGTFVATLDGLPPDIVVHYRAKVVAGQTVAFGADQTFQTVAGPAPVLTVSTWAAAGVGTDIAVLMGSLSQMSGIASALVNFQWGTTQAYGNETAGQTLTVAGGSFAATLSGLLPDTVYYYRTKAVAGQAIAYGPGLTFRTAAVTPIPAPAPAPAASGVGGAGGGGGGGGLSLPTTVSLSGLSGDTELKVDSSGKAQINSRLRDTEGKIILSINSGTSLRYSSGVPLTSLFVTAPAAVPPAPPQSAVVIAQELGPGGATFAPAITLTLTYESAKLPVSVLEKDLSIAFWDGSIWIPLETTVDTVAKTVSARVSHFTVFGILGKISPRSSAVPSLAIESLDVAGGNVKVMVSVKDVKLVAPKTENVAGEGHLHFYVDVDIPVTPGKRTETALGTYKATTETSVVWENLKPGQHTLGVQLVNNDHTPFTPPITTTIKVTVSAPTALSPAPSAPTAAGPPVPAPSPSPAVPSPAPTPGLPSTPSPAAGPAGVNWNLFSLAVVAVIAGILVLLLRHVRKSRR